MKRTLLQTDQENIRDFQLLTIEEVSRILLTKRLPKIPISTGKDTQYQKVLYLLEKYSTPYATKDEKDSGISFRTELVVRFLTVNSIQEHVYLALYYVHELKLTECENLLNPQIAIENPSIFHQVLKRFFTHPENELMKRFTAIVKRVLQEKLNQSVEDLPPEFQEIEKTFQALAEFNQQAKIEIEKLSEDQVREFLMTPLPPISENSSSSFKSIHIALSAENENIITAEKKYKAIRYRALLLESQKDCLELHKLPQDILINGVLPLLEQKMLATLCVTSSQMYQFFQSISHTNKIIDLSKKYAKARYLFRIQRMIVTIQKSNEDEKKDLLNSEKKQVDYYCLELGKLVTTHPQLIFEYSKSYGMSPLEYAICGKIKGFEYRTEILLIFYEKIKYQDNLLLAFKNIITANSYCLCIFSYHYGLHGNRHIYTRLLEDINHLFTVLNILNPNELYTAIKQGDSNTVQNFITNGIDLNFQNKFGVLPGLFTPPLTFAVIKNQVAIAKMFLAAGADVNAVNSRNENALMAYLDRDGEENLPLNLEIVSLLIDAKINVNHTDNHQRPVLYYAVIAEHIDIIKIILEQKPNIEMKDRDNFTPLDYSTGPIRALLEDYLKNNINKETPTMKMG